VADTLAASTGTIAGGWSLTIASTGTLKSPKVAKAPLLRRTENSMALSAAKMEIEHLSMSPGGPPQLTLSGQPGQAFLLEMSTDLLHWKLLEAGTLADTSFLFVDRTATQSNCRFYRVSAVQKP
jgi:hypothetical protein